MELDQVRVDALLQLNKKLTASGTIDFPSMGSYLALDATDLDEREDFKIDVQRKGKKKPTKCTYQLRYEQIEILLRVDIDGPPHDNPDGTTVPCPHIHIWREHYMDSWAFPLPLERFPSPANLVAVFKDFLKYCKITNIPVVQESIL